MTAASAAGGEGARDCHRYLDTYVRFPDGSFRCPNLAIYCARLPDPQAVSENVSACYEEKDRLGLPFYLAQGIADVVVYDPRTEEVVHATHKGRSVHDAPVESTFTCGCGVTIPVKASPFYTVPV